MTHVPRVKDRIREHLADGCATMRDMYVTFCMARHTVYYMLREMEDAGEVIRERRLFNTPNGQRYTDVWSLKEQPA